MVSVWLASSLMAKHGQFLLMGIFFKLFLGLEEFVISGPSFAKFLSRATFTKHCQSAHEQLLPVIKFFLK